MSEHTVKHLTCDRCGSKTSVELNTFGGHCMWLHIEKNLVRSLMLPKSMDMSCDLCEACANDLIEFMKGKDGSSACPIRDEVE